MAASRRFLETSKHPLVVLLAGTLLGSVLIPAVNDQIDRARHLRALKTERSNVVLQSSWAVERQISLLQTAFDSFFKDEVASGLATNESRQVLRSRVYALYQDFDRDAWWWHWQVLEEVRTLGLLDGDGLARLERAVRRYHEALLATTDTLDPYWAHLVRSQEPISAETGLKIVNEVQPGLKKLGARRRAEIRDMMRAIIS